MTSLSLKIVLDEGAVTRTLMFDAATKVKDAHGIVRDKILTLDPNKEYGFFLTSVENDSAGFWLQENKTLEYYMLRDGDSLFYLPKLRNLKVRMLDGAVKTLQVDESQKIEDLMFVICEKIGTANHEEYGLCREETQAIEETTKPPTGTLTLKRKAREKDAQLQQMSKKLKTDDNVEWLDQRKTLRELRVEPKDTLLFKRRLFYSDRNIDSRDPVQLNLLYVQTRDAILDGRQVVTEEKAVEFAGIQCQVQYGDFQEKKHKPGFIENLKEFLPEQYASSWGVEKKVIKMHQKLIGMSSVEAKHLYTKTARELPTYGVTFFLVKEQQKGKKKLVPRLLGINSASILRLDEGTKEILQTWLLTQVKSYTAGNESFTLNFGDYSDKSYVVKTNEATRIKDILEGYIDIIRKKLSAPINYTSVEGEAICEDMVESSKGTVVQTVAPSKVVGHSLVGPSQIISVDQGHMSHQGTQIVTVQQIITSVRGDTSQQPTKGEISMRSNIPQDFRKRLNHLNSECVKTVLLLSNPTAENLQQVRKTVDDLKDGMPGIEKGVKEVAGSLHGDASQKLLEELDELCNYMNTLAATTRRSDLRNPDRLMEAQDAARKVAEISTQMCFSLDPKTKRRSTLLMRSRNSFIQDEKTEASLRRASFINAADNASQAVEEAQEDLDQRYNGPILSDDQLRRLEIKAVDRMGKLNAAIALLLNAHADPRNIDYEMAVNSMKTINEIMPEFVHDAKPLAGVGDSSSGRALREQIGQLLNRTGTICKLTGSHDIHAMQFEGDEFANVANKLIYTFSRAYCKPGGKPMPDEENKITSQCKDIEEKANLLLSVTNELMSLEQNDPRTSEVEAAQVKCSDAVRGLLACAKLTAPSIHEPHCQSALTAAVENLSSSAQSLILCSKPLVEKPNRHNIAHQLTDGSFNLARALDKLKEMYANIDGPNTEEMDVSEAQNIQEDDRLKFIATAASTRNAIMDAESELQQMMKTPVPLETKPTRRDPAVQRLLSQKLAQLNAAVAALLKATSDQDNPDYDTAKTAANTIRELAPDLIKNTKSIQGTMNENAWNETISTLEDMLEATRAICLNAEDSNIQEMNNAASRFANSSGKLVYVFNPRKNPRKEKEIIDLSRTALRDTSQMLSNVYLLAEAVGGKDGDDLDSAGVRVVDAAQILLRTAEITAPSIADARCQATLLSSIDSLSDLTRTLENTWKPLVQSSDYCQIVDDLNRNLNVVQIGLKKLRRACHDNTDEEDITNGETDENKQQEIKRLKFIATKTAAKNALIDANKQFDEIMKKPKAKKSHDEVKSRNPEVERCISDKLAELNAAIAKFLQANSDKENPDYEVAEKAFNEISKLTPDIIKDSEHLYGNVNDESWKEIAEHLKAILDATQGMCSISQGDDFKEMNDAATKLAKSSGKLIYIFNPRKNPKNEKQISDLSRSAVEQTSQMFSRVHQLAESIGGEKGNKLDEAGVKVVDAAHQLLKTAEITAPSVSDARCRDTLLSAIQRLSGHLNDLENTCMPFIDKHRGTENQLNNDLKSVEMVLNSLRDACLDCAENNDTAAREIGGNEIQERKKLKFIATKSAAKKALSEADKQLNKIMIKPVSKKSNEDISRTNPEVQLRISGKLAELNAAVATLVQASTDNNIPDYENAEMAINTICKLTPDIIKDTKHLRGNLDDKTWKEIADHLKAILDATQGMCSNSHEGDVQEINEAASKFAESSGKLIYIFNPRKNPKKEEQISDLSRSAAEQTSQMLSRVYQLAESVGGEQGTKLDEAGVKVVDVAKQLLKTAEITAPSISDARCRETLLSAIHRLSGHLKDLENTWMPLVNEPKHQEIGNELQHNLKSVAMVLDYLKDACLDGAGNDDLPVSGITKDEMQERKRLQFIATKSAAIKSLNEADKKLKEILKKPISKESKDQNKSPDVKRNLSEKLAGLNAAIATLLQASSERDNPDYDNAEAAINDICKLTEDIIKDIDHLRGCTDDKTLKETIGHLKAMLDATRGICFNCRENDFTEMNDAASTFSKSSGKLIYIFNPRVNPKKEEQISQLSRSAVEQTSRMLSHVYQLTESVGNEDSHKLDDVGVKVVDFAQQLLKTAEITAPCISDARCRETLLSAIHRLSGHLKDLENTWIPLVNEPKHREIGNELQHNLKSVEMVLNDLKDACLDGAGNDDLPVSGITKDKMQERKRLQFIATKSAAIKSLKEADKKLEEILKKPISKVSKDQNKSPDVKRNLAEKLAGLNAAIASLLQASSDRDNPDYDSAETAINDICKLTEDIIKDTDHLRGCTDDKTLKETIEHLKAMLDATRGICFNCRQNDFTEMNDAASTFSKSSGKLIYIFNPRVNPKKEEQISQLSRSAVEQTSRMLSHVYQLTESVGNEDSHKLDDVGVKVVDFAQQLLKTAEITAPCISDARCRETLLSAIHRLSGHLKDLENTWIPLVNEPKHREIGNELQHNLKSVEMVLNDLKDACLDGAGNDDLPVSGITKDKMQERKRLQFIATKSAAIKSLKEADKKLEEILKKPISKVSKDQNKSPDVKRNLAEKLAGLNAAIASLLQASSDRDNPDYDSAETAINDICKLTEDIIKDTDHLRGCTDDKTLKETIEHLKAMLDATRGICFNCRQNDFTEMNDAASTFSKSSGKLIYIFNPRVNPKKEEQISLLSRSAVEQTSRMLSHLYQLTESVGNEDGHKLDDVGVKVVDFAQQLLKTAEVTAPSIADARCKTALLEAINRLSDQVRAMENTWKPFVKIPEHRQTGDLLNKDLNLIHIALDKLKDACHDDDGTDTIKHPETQRLLYIATALKAKKAMQAAEKELNDKTPVKALDKSEVPAMKRSLSQRLARLNSSIASLVLATADEEKPDYNAATRSIDTISNFTPDIIRDVKSIKGDIDKKSWKIVDENLNDVVVITRNICRHVEDNNPKELKEEAYRCAKSVGRLSYVFGPAPDTRKENQILDLSRSATEQTSLMLSDVHQLADKVGGDAGKKLNGYQIQVSKASKILQKTAEILAPTISDAYCQETLISCVDDLSKLSEELKRTWKPLVQAPQLQQNGEKLEENLKHVHTTLNKLRNACQKTDDSETTTSPTHINVQHAKDKIKEVEKLFLEDKALELPANERLDKPGTTIKPITEQREQISHNIGALNEAIARLLQAMLDLKNPGNVRRVEKSIDVMSKLTPDIVMETIALQRNVDDDSRQILFEEAKSLCTASQAVCDSIEKGNMEELNNAASQYAQTSRKLRYIISLRTYPNKEKKILDMSRSACERTSLMLSRVSRLAQHIEREKRIELDTSGAKVANAAQVLLNNAQITASSINEKNCQSALMSTVDTLTEHTQDLRDIWVPLAQQTEHKEIGEQLRRDLRLLLTELDKLKIICQDDTEDVPMVVQHKVNSNAKQKQPDIENIDNILEDIQKNVKEGKTPEQNKVTERLIVEDTPLRSLASKILDSAMTKLAVVKSKSKDVSSKEHNELSAFSKELQAAIKSVDITNAKCRNDPLDARKRQELENAIMNLQQICLLSRRNNGEQNNIVDLADYIGDVSESVDTIANVVDDIKREHGSEALMDIKDACERIKDNARKVLNLEEEPLGDGNIIDEMLKIDQFAMDCEKEVEHMNLAVPKINDEKARQKLQDKLQSLACCCDLLRFATKSSISSAKSATLDEGLQNLEDIEKKIQIILKPTEGDKVKSREAISKSALQAAQTALATAVATGDDTELPKALTKYAVQIRGICVDHQKFRLKDHLKKLLDLLKTHAVIICRRVATWQEIKAPETTATTDQILEELKSFAEEVEKSENPSQKGSSSPVQILKDSDIKNLLIPSESTVTGDRTQLNNKLQQQIQKLNSISGTIALSLHKPESLSRSLHTTSDAAQQLAAIARGIKSEDPVQHKRIEEGVQEMSIATYNLLKTAESSSHSKNTTDSRRRLLQACRLLNEPINKLGRAAFPEDKLRNECSEMNRNLQLQQTFLQANTPTCALSYTDCLDALNNQNDVIHKLRSEESIPRTDVTTSLRYVTSSVCNSAEFAAQSAYLLSLSDADQNVAKHGVVDLARLYKVTEATEDTCLQIICAGPGEQAAELNGCFIKQVQQLQEAIDDATDKVKGDIKHPLIANSRELKSALNSLHGGVHLPTCKEEDFTLKIMKHLDTIKKINAIIKIVPQPYLDKDPKKTSMSTEVIDHTKSLLASTSMMVKKASSSEEKTVTWTMFGSGEVIKAFEALITCIREKGAEAGFLESLKSQEDQDAPPKSFVQKQVDLVNCWLQKPTSKDKDKAAGVKAAEHVTSLAEQMCEDLTGAEREEMKHMIAETKELVHDCTLKYNSDKAYLLLERLKELRKMLEKGVVTRVVEDFLVEIPLDNLDTLQTETDARKRKFLLERKIAELLAQLGRVTKTARLVASTGTAPKLELASTTDQVELLAPALVKAAQDRIDSPDDKDSIKHYEDLLQQYAQSLAKVRDLCDQAVDPIDFAQAAGETMHRIKEDSTVHSNDPQKSIYTSKVILKLGNRVVKAGMKSSLVQHDPELKETLAKIDQTVTAKYNDVKKADWGDVMAEIMKKTSEVESALGGENIFLKQADNNQPIFAAALDLHAAVREWSARDNEIVAVAKRMAVLMARLSDYMNTENKRELLHTSKSIVSESREVTALAKKLALECTDMRIRTNLLQVCERIPTISGQLKMLTTVKGSSFGQGSKEDKEAMTMLVGNAQNLMTSIQEVVKAAASASVKIMSQRGCRMKWVRRNFY